MNILNALILFFIAIYVAQGFYRGFLISLANTVGMFVSWLLGFLFSPLMSSAIENGSFYKFMLSFSGTVDQLQDKGNMLVSGLSGTQIESIVQPLNMPIPFEKLISSNMADKVFEGQGLTTVSDYIGTSITNVVVNIFSFLVIYLIARIIISLLVNAVNYSSPLPVLKRFDSTIGAGVGLLRGFLGMFVVAMIIPVILISMPTDLFTDMIANSSMATFFYQNNFLLNMISGTI